MQAFPIPALTEADFDPIIKEIGGFRARPDATRSETLNADYVLGETVIELKMLDEEGFDKPGRQFRLAELFRASQADRPVVVLDPDLLDELGRRKYRTIAAEPVKRLIPHAKAQLAQTRIEFPETSASILWIFNNGYTALDHETLEALVANRVRQDTSSIDGVIVSGCYYHSDGFDSVFLWPCTYVPIRLGHSFPEFERLREKFQELANSYMTQILKRADPKANKFEVRDLVFDVDGIRYVRPAPVMGGPSDFFVRGRSRANSSGIETCPPVALVVPGLTRAGHAVIARAIGEPGGALGNWPAWQRHVAGAREAATTTKPLLTMQIDAQEFLDGCAADGQTPSIERLNRVAHEAFEDRIRSVLASACERAGGGVVLSAYVLAVTQEIGQDQANDVSDIALVREHPNGEPSIRPLAENLRIFHEHEVALAAAYAVREGVDVVQWNRNRRNGWF
jgi:hypothetical protein